MLGDSVLVKIVDSDQEEFRIVINRNCSLWKLTVHLGLLVKRKYATISQFEILDADKKPLEAEGWLTLVATASEELVLSIQPKVQVPPPMPSLPQVQYPPYGPQSQQMVPYYGGGYYGGNMMNPFGPAPGHPPPGHLPPGYPPTTYQMAPPRPSPSESQQPQGPPQSQEMVPYGYYGSNPLNQQMMPFTGGPPAPPKPPSPEPPAPSKAPAPPTPPSPSGPSAPLEPSSSPTSAAPPEASDAPKPPAPAPTVADEKDEDQAPTASHGAEAEGSTKSPDPGEGPSLTRQDTAGETTHSKKVPRSSLDKHLRRRETQRGGKKVHYVQTSQTPETVDPKPPATAQPSNDDDVSE